MLSNFLLVLLLLYSFTTDCIGQKNETRCTQYSNAYKAVASCVGLGLTEVPSDLPNNITELNLSNNSLSYNWTGDILRFKNLTRLRLSQNNISFIEENTLSGTPLVYLFLQHNMLENIPVEVLHISSLKYLNLENNNIKNLTVPLRHYRTTVRLQVLILKNTQLSLLQGDIFAGLNLQSMDLSFNNLESLPHLVFGKRNMKLETLLLGVNRLSSIPSCLQHLTVLKHLDLSYNRIKTVGDASLTGLQNLKYLYLSGNGIVSMADNAFSHLWLTRLNLSSNNLTTVPTSLTSMSSMKMLSLGGNPLRQVPPGMLQSMPALHTLELQKVGLSYLPSGAFSNSSLTHLSLAFNHLQALPMDVFSGTALKVLQLQGNLFSQFPRAAATLETLQTLDLRHNNIAMLQQVDDFSRLTNLTRLLLHNIGLRRIDKEDIFHGMESLEELDLSGNDVTTLPPNTFHSLPSLRRILLGQNRLQSLPINIFSNLTMLRYIDLSHNELEYLSVLSVTTMPKESTPSQTVLLENNPWYCDMNLCPLMDWHSKLHLNVSTPGPMCATPANMTFHHALSTVCASGTDTTLSPVTTPLSTLKGTDNTSVVSYESASGVPDQTLTAVLVILAVIVLLVLVVVGVMLYRWKTKQAPSSYATPYFTPDIRRQYLEDLQALLPRPDSCEPVYDTIDDLRCPTAASSHIYAMADDDLDTRSIASTGTYLSFPGYNESTTYLSVIGDEDDSKSITSHATYLSLIGDTDSIDSQPVYLTLTATDVDTNCAGTDSSMLCDEDTASLPGQPVYSYPMWRGQFPREKSTLSCGSISTVSRVILEDLEDT
ncbi:hypothetical protein Bbelb_372940 [Branchiostoma belcheri]|nr:hypothetical protein Bbelb_372940 [Branchiostoma belcheri]